MAFDALYVDIKALEYLELTLLYRLNTSCLTLSLPLHALHLVEASEVPDAREELHEDPDEV